MVDIHGLSGYFSMVLFSLFLYPMYFLYIDPSTDIEDRVTAASFSTNLSQVMLISGDTTTQLIILLFSSEGSGSDS